MHVTLEKAAELLKAGKVVGVPTETVYGLAASISSPQGIANIFSLKRRPANNPLIVHLANAEQLNAFVAVLPEGAPALAKAFWPGPLTLVVPVKSAAVPEMARAGLQTSAFRVPAHPLAHALLERAGPLLMPSANLSGRPSSTCACHVEADFGEDFPVLDGGDCRQGVESTIVVWREGEWLIVRLGALSPEAFLPVLGYCPRVVEAGKGEQSAPLCPGQLYRHYAPKAKLGPVEAIPSGDTGVILGFEDRNYPRGCRVISLGVSSTPEEAAHRLYAALRQLDEEGIEQAWVDMDVPNSGLWLTVKERLRKASQSPS